MAVGSITLAAGAGAAQAQGQFTTAGDLAEKLELGIRSGLLTDLHGVMIAHGDKVVFEQFFEGPDFAWADDLGTVRFQGDTLHDLRSVTKSITSLLYGIALSMGKVPAPDAPLLDAFPDYAHLKEDPQRASWTVGNALNMTLGTEWNEDLPYYDPRNSEIMMENAPDRYRFILERPIIEQPGVRWHYNGGCTALLGYLIAKGTGQDLEEFAKEHLFTPLGISQFHWMRGSDGVPSPASGLRLTAEGLTRIGQMVAAEGKWNEQQVVPQEWLATYLKPQVRTAFGSQYSNSWYWAEHFVPAANQAFPVISGAGNGGQRLFVIPALDVVITVFAGAYSRPDQWITPQLVLERIALPNLLKL
ncbi:hypothetical protein GCM10007094_42930 [Pseudovibrio japonicus]|uniref:Beta-lactamase-related domain-containing protein n=1 Tax=Pseudovibrio japonicus TaxID=366534 RepID=A0ABQ3EP26_9HYPH|nr:serine hydrolase [Pseudovibrio japonicus]GHB49139.1 hypothetical protein GCM10007094_42930 [Pseudovibrio japonicus]